MRIDIKKLSPAAQRQIREKLEAKKREPGTGNLDKGTGDANCRGPVPGPRNDKGDGGMGSSRPTTNKLNAERVDGYASKHEAERAAELRWLEKAGKIRDLQEQVKFVLIPPIWEEIPRTGKRGKPIKPKRVCVQRGLAYYADFVYIDCATGNTVVEDAKGYKGGATYRVFVNKRKMMRQIYGIKVVEV